MSGIGNQPNDQVEVTGTVSVDNFPVVQDVNVIDSVLPDGAATEATLALIKTQTDNLDVPLSTRTKPSDIQNVTGNVAVTNFPVVQPVSGTVSVDNFPPTQNVSGTVAVSNFPASQDVVVTNTPTVNIGSIPEVEIKNDVGNPVPISATSLPLPTGAATSALQTQPGVDIGDVTVNNASGAGAVNIQDGGNSITVDGTVSSVQSGTWTTARSWVLSTTTDSVSTNPVVSSSVTVTRLSTSTTPNTISANANRKQLMIDTEAGIHYVLLGAGTVSSTNYSVQLTANSYYEVPSMWTGVVSLVKSTGTGNAQITEIS